MPITPRRAALGLLGLLTVGAVALLLRRLLLNIATTEITVAVALSVGVFGVLWWAYWRRWPPAGPVAVVLITLLVSLALPQTYVTGSMHFVLLLPPIMALVLAGPTAIALSGFGALTLVWWRAQGTGPAANPETWFAYGLMVGALALGRQAAANAQRQAEAQARQAQAARDQAEHSAAAARFQAHLLSVVERAVVARDAAGRVTFWNRHAETVFQWPAQAAQGRLLDELVRLPLTPPRQAERDAALARGASWTGETDAERRDGSRLPLLLTFTPLPGGAGTVLLALDLTERRQAEAALRQSETRFRALIEHSGDLLALMNAEVRLTYLGPSLPQVLGYAPDALVGTSPLDLIHPDDLTLSYENLPRLLAEPGRLIYLEQRLRHQDGRWLWFEGTITNLLHVPEVQALVVNCRDVTARRAALDEVRRLNTELEARVQQRTAQLSAANRELEAFSYSVSHDLRQPLRAINGFTARLMEQRDRLDERGQQYLDRVTTAGQRMGQLIDDLLALAHLGRGEVRRSPVNLSELADRAVAGLRAAHPDRQVECAIAPDLYAACDARLVQIVLDNLLGNAFKFTARQPAARVEFGQCHPSQAAPPAGSAPPPDPRFAEPPLNPAIPIFCVRDNGAGFDMRYADRLFGAFQRLHTETEFPGSGVGLATVQRIITRHGGRIWAVSTPGAGASFYFTLGA